MPTSRRAISFGDLDSEFGLASGLLPSDSDWSLGQHTGFQLHNDSDSGRSCGLRCLLRVGSLSESIRVYPILGLSRALLCCETRRRHIDSDTDSDTDSDIE